MTRGFVGTLVVLAVAALLCSSLQVLGQTDPDDFAILMEFHKGLVNSEILDWPLMNKGNDPCGSKWPHVFCENSRVTQIQVQNMGLTGPLPQNLNKLSMLNNLGLQKNNFSGKLPSFNGLGNLKYAYLGHNQFDTIPSDFFVGLTSLQVLSLDENPLNRSTGWSLPPEFENSAQLMNLSLMGCNLAGPMPDFLGNMPSLSVLKLSYNNLRGEIPVNLSGSALQILWLNNQKGSGLTGPIDVITSMLSLTDAWLHGNSFTGPIPDSIGALSSLTRLWLNNNNLVGLVPENITALPMLQDLQLQNNKLMGPIPEMNFPNFTYTPNLFCQSKPGVPCSAEVTALLDFLADLNYPLILAESWSGNDPCASPWHGISCSDNKVSLLNLQNLKLNGTISPSIGKLDSLADIRLGGNNLAGPIPLSLANLKSLKMLDVSSNNLSPPLPKFSDSVKLLITGNRLLVPSPPGLPQPGGNPPGDSPPATGNPPSTPGTPPPPSNNHNNSDVPSKVSKKTNVLIYVVPIAVAVFIILPVSIFLYHQRRGRATAFSAPNSIVVHPRDPSDPDNLVKIAVASNTGTSIGTSDLQSSSINSGTTEAHVIESGNLVVSVQILRGATRNFSPENELGRGGFGVVYKGELHDGAMIAVKRMETVVISSKAFDEFQSEIAVLSKVRHRNLVSLLGYSIEGNERLLVYEYMPQGALSKHLFQWEELSLEPLSWKKRLNIALDVARAMEYLHNLAHQCFIHRDLKSSNILLGDDYRAKVSDFGLVKLAPDGKNSVVTRLAGTFGYLAPEYAVTGKITTKADVFSFGVVLMELLTGLIALDESRSEEKRHLASWFCQIKSSKQELRDAIDKSLDVTDETLESISIMAELAGHCAAREPHQRPDMGHAVNVLAPLVEKWKPMKDDQEEYLGIDLRQPLLQMVKGWQDADSTNVSSISYNDSKGSIPSRPDGFAESFTSADGR